MAQLKERALTKKNLTRDDMRELLSLRDPDDLRRLYAKAYEVKKEHVGTTVYLRGLIELSNFCEKNCYYCGIRKGNHSVKRYSMKEHEILEACEHALEWGYGSVVLQAGERTTKNFASFIENVILRIKDISSGGLGITLSLGEQSMETYRCWFDAGAHRYLLRIETSNEDLYGKMHPADHRFALRLECLSALRHIGYQVGTGVMIGLPDQTIEDLADDILFFKEIDADMIGMGPYIPHRDTPMAGWHGESRIPVKDSIDLALKMIAVTRIALPDVNIASTTALQALSETGRELGLIAGANVIMPNLTDVRYRNAYRLYDNKPCCDENADECRTCLESRIKGIGETIGYHRWGDSPHFLRRTARSAQL